ncbi:hypothetical protein ACSI5I_001564 [Vibrio vulnificus]
MQITFYEYNGMPCNECKVCTPYCCVKNIAAPKKKTAKTKPKTTPYKDRLLSAAFQPAVDVQRQNQFPRSMPIRDDRRVKFSWEQFNSAIQDPRSHYYGSGDEPETIIVNGRTRDNPMHNGKARAGFLLPYYLAPKAGAEPLMCTYTNDYEVSVTVATYRRGQLETLGMDLFVLDYDNKFNGERVGRDDPRHVSILDFVNAYKEFEFVLHTSYSHTPDSHCFRVIFPLPARIQYSLIESKSESILEFFKGLDRNALCQKHGFYLPSSPDTGRIYTYHNKGRYWLNLESDRFAYNPDVVMDNGEIKTKSIAPAVVVTNDSLTPEFVERIKNVITTFKNMTETKKMTSFGNKGRFKLACALRGSGLPVSTCERIYNAASYTSKRMTQGFVEHWNSADKAFAMGTVYSGWETVEEMAGTAPDATESKEVKWECSEDDLVKIQQARELLASDSAGKVKRGEKLKKIYVERGIWTDEPPATVQE